MKINCFTKTEEEMNTLLVEEKVGQLYTLNEQQKHSTEEISPAISVRNEIKRNILKDLVAEDMQNYLSSHAKPKTTEASFEFASEAFYKMESTVMLNISFRWKTEKGWETLLVGMVRCDLEKHDENSMWLSSTTLIFYEIDEDFWKKIRLKTIL